MSEKAKTKGKAKEKSGRVLKTPDSSDPIKALLSRSPKFQATMDHFKRAWGPDDSKTSETPPRTAKTKLPKKS